MELLNYLIIMFSLAVSSPESTLDSSSFEVTHAVKEACMPIEINDASISDSFENLNSWT